MYLNTITEPIQFRQKTSPVQRLRCAIHNTWHGAARSRLSVAPQTRKGLTPPGARPPERRGRGRFSRIFAA